MLAVWSAAANADFHARLTAAGFAVRVQPEPARPGNPKELHTIFLATSPVVPATS